MMLKKSFNKGIFVYVLIAMLVILLLKTVISTYLISALTLIPSIIIVVVFVIMFFKKKIDIRLYDILFAVMLIVGALSGIIHHQRFIAILYQIKSLSVYYLLFMIIRNLNFSTNQIKKFTKSLNVITIILILFSIVEIIFHKTILFPKSWADDIVYADNFIRAYSLICNPNVYAFFLIFVLFYNYKYNKIELSFVNILFYALIFTGIVLSISRSGLLVAIGIVFLWLLSILVQKNKEKIFDALKVLVFVGTLCALFTVTIYRFNNIYRSSLIKNNNVVEKDKAPSINEIPEDTVDKITTSENFISRIIATTNSSFLKNSLTNGRLAIVAYGLDVWKTDKLFGTGFSSFLTASSFLNPNKEAEEKGLSYADNQYIALLVETGVLGFVATAAAFILILVDEVKNRKFYLFIASLVFAFFGLFINVLEVQLIAFMFFLLLGFDYSKKVVNK